MAPFLVLGTPRSRTAWLAKFLSYGGRTCLHEPSRHMGGLDDLLRLLDRPGVAISDSGLTLRWRDIVMHRPDALIVVVRRPVDDVVRSFAAMQERIGLWPSTEGVPDHHRIHMERDKAQYTDEVRRATIRVAEAADDLMENTPAMHVAYSALGYAPVQMGIFQYCHGIELPLSQWQKWNGVRVLAPERQHMQDAWNNREGLRRLFPELSESA